MKKATAILFLIVVALVLLSLLSACETTAESTGKIVSMDSHKDHCKAVVLHRDAADPSYVVYRTIKVPCTYNVGDTLKVINQTQ